MSDSAQRAEAAIADVLREHRSELWADDDRALRAALQVTRELADHERAGRA